VHRSERRELPAYRTDEEYEAKNGDGWAASSLRSISMIKRFVSIGRDPDTYPVSPYRKKTIKVHSTLFGIELEALIRVNQVRSAGVDLDPEWNMLEAIDLTTSDKAVLTDTMNAYIWTTLSFVLEEQFTKDRVLRRL
jgi:hypothetical protein